jgi:hypothetical protein
MREPRPGRPCYDAPMTPPPAIPAPPMRPDPQECCNRGCCPCIMDYYADAMARWEKSVRALGHDPDRLRNAT